MSFKYTYPNLVLKIYQNNPPNFKKIMTEALALE